MCPDMCIRAACHLRSVVSTIFIAFEQRVVIRHAVSVRRKRINNPNTVNKLDGLTSANFSRSASPVDKNCESAPTQQGFYGCYTLIGEYLL